MLQNLSIYIIIAFLATVLLTLLLAYFTIKNADLQETRNKANFILIGMIAWIALQTILTINNVYNSNLNALPPKIFVFGVFPMIFLMISLFLTTKGRLFMDSLPLKNLTYISVVRIPVEIVLYFLFVERFIPEIMTFEGQNFDIVAGISALFVAYFGFNKNIPNKKLLLIWNFISFGLLMNIVITAILSAPSPFQKFGLEQPNIGILHFPVSLLPTFIVPVVMFSHLVAFRKLLKSQN